MSFLRKPLVHWILGIALGAVFVYASLDKIDKPAEFARIVYHYQLAGPNALVGPEPANLLAIVLPWLEVVCGVLLISGIWRREAALLTSVMLVAFMIAIGWALYQGIDIENCGCFSVSGAGRGFGLRLLLGDAVMLAGALVLVVLAPRLAAKVG